MPYKFIRPNWKAINKVLDSDDISEFSNERKAFNKLIDEKLWNRYKNKMKAEEEKKVASLKSLSVESQVYYIGSDPLIEFGAMGTKLKDGRTRMTVKFTAGVYMCYYTNLKIDPLTSEERASNNIVKRLNNKL